METRKASPTPQQQPPKKRRLARLGAALGRAARDRSYWIAVGGGLAGALAFEPVAWGWLIPLVPVCCFISIGLAPTPAAAGRRALALGWVYGFGVLHWLCTLYAYNPLAPLGIFLLGGYLGAYIGLAGYAARRWFWAGNGATRYLSFAALWLLVEWFRTLGRLAVPLAQLGHAWATWPWAIQIASWLGELGVSLEVLALAGGLLLWVRLVAAGQAQTNRSRAKAVAIVVLLTMAFLLWSVFAKGIAARWDAQSLSPTFPHRDLRVALIQPNVDQMTKFASYVHPDEAVREALSRKITTETEQLALSFMPETQDLIVFPETTFTEPDFFHNEPLKQSVSALARSLKADLFLGGDRDASTSTTFEMYNSAYFVHADGQFDSQVYDKMSLVPFGEYLPYFDLIPGFQEFVVGIGSFNEGRSPVLYQTHGLKFGSLICFESTFASMGRRLARLGADFLVVITNDAWFGLSAGPAQHHHASLLRAVETRRWVLRCANTGISSVIAPSGRAVDSLGLNRRGTLQGRISIANNAPATVFMRWGNSWLWVAMPLFVLSLWARRKQNSPPDFKKKHE